PSIQGKVEVANFDFPLAALLPPPVESSAPRQQQLQRLHLDSGSAEIGFNQQGVIVRNGVVHRSGSQVNVDISAALTDGELTDTSRVVAHLIVRNAALADLQQLA